MKRDNVYDVAIVGGGIMGLNTAYQIRSETGLQAARNRAVHVACTSTSLTSPHPSAAARPTCGWLCLRAALGLERAHLVTRQPSSAACTRTIR